jgi:hypothetical protein
VQHLLKITGVWEKFTTDSSPSAASTN